MKRGLHWFLPLFAVAGCQDARITIAVTDAPVDQLDAVSLRFTGIEVERSDGEIEGFELSPPRDVDLLALEGGTRAVLLDSQAIDPADYRSIRLKVLADGSSGSSFVRLDDGTVRALKLADEDAGRLKLLRSFGVERRDELFFTIDVDLRKSLLVPTDGIEPYRLVPALRLLEDRESGALAGTVAPELVPDGCTPAVYVYTGSGIVPDDVGSATEPLNSSRVRLVDDVYRYRVGLLAAGSYTAALTCQAQQDQPDANDAISFAATQDVSITAEQTASADF